MPLNPDMNTSSGTSTLTYCALCQIKLQLQGLALHDTWRTLVPLDRDYSFFSTPFQKYSRIYLFLSQQDLTYLNQATIEPMFLSDHHPISITLTFPETIPRTTTWCLNPSLLKDPDILSQLKSRQLEFAENTTPDISPITIWEGTQMCDRERIIGPSRKC